MMSGQQEKIELEMRPGAIEFMLCKLISNILKANSILKAGAQSDGSARSGAEIMAGLDQIAEHAKTQKFPGLNAAYSDLMSDEFSIAIKRLTEMTKIMAEAP